MAPPVLINEEEVQLLNETGAKGGSDFKITPFTITLILVVSIGGLLFGYDTGIISGAILQIKKEFDLSSIEQEWVIGSATAGAMAGAFFGGWLNDFAGRKPSTVFAAFAFIAGSLTMAFSYDFLTILIGRVITGVGVGLASMTVPMYISEVSPPRIRGALVSSNILFVTGGQFLSYLIAAGLSFTDNGWRYMLGIGAIPPIIQLIGMFFLPESPRYLIKSGKKDKAREILERMEISNTENYIEEIQNSLHKVGSWKELFTNYRRQLLIGCCLLALQQFCGINTAMYYSATILKMAGFESDTLAIIFSASVAFTNMIMTLLGMYLIDKKGRRKLLLSTLLGCALGLAALGVSFYLILGFQTAQNDCSLYNTCSGCLIDKDCGYCFIEGSIGSCSFGNEEGPIYSNATCGNGSGKWLYEGGCNDSIIAGWLALFSLVLYVAFFAPAMGIVPWAVMSEIFPLTVRGKAAGMASASNWTANLVVSVTLLTLFNNLTQAGTFWLYSSFCVFTWVFVFFFLPETKGRSLEDMEKIFSKK